MSIFLTIVLVALLVSCLWPNGHQAVGGATIVFVSVCMLARRGKVED